MCPTNRWFTAAVLAATVLVAPRFAAAGCPYNKQQLNKMKQQAKAYQQWANTYCRGGKYADVCAQIRQYINRVNAIVKQCNKNPPPPPDDCDELRRKIRRKAQESFEYASSTLQYYYELGYDSYRIQYQQLGTNYCGERLWYYAPKWTTANSFSEAYRTVRRVTNNGGVVRFVTYR